MHLLLNSHVEIIGDRNLILRENIHVCDVRLRGIDLLSEGTSTEIKYLKRITVTYKDRFGITDTDTISSSIKYSVTNTSHLIFLLQV